MPSAHRVAFGLRAHSGWAVLVALEGPALSPKVVDRRRLALCDGSFPQQPYHAAENLSGPRAAVLVARAVETAQRLGCEAVAAAVADWRRGEVSLAGAGLLLGSGRPLPEELSAILAAHPLIHTAEGVLYRDVLRAACEKAGIPVSAFRERELEATAERWLKLAASPLRARLTALGKPLGPPWSQDEKLAALAAWLVLAGAGA